jgi:SPP1 gp7 family putative phage head morphogenesis protein
MVARKGDNELIDAIYTNGTGGVNDTLLQRYAGGFDKAVTNVFGAGRQYQELETELRINAGRFGTYKTYDLCRQLEQARQSGMSADKFKELAKARLGAYNAYQRTEYNTLVARSRTAKQWERFREERLLYPNIEWLATASVHPRPEHVEFTGLILPQDDPFWQRNQPGNEYNCKCDWRTTDKEAATNRPADIPPAKGLEGNPAETHELVTGRHPYFSRNNGAPEWVNNKALLQLPEKVAFVEKTTGSGKTYREHRLVERAGETGGNREIAALLLDNGYKDVRLLPKIDHKERVLRERYYGKGYNFSKCPDAKIGNENAEFKTTTNRNMSVTIGNAAKQAAMVCVKITDNITVQHIKDVVERQWNIESRKNLIEIIVVSNGNIHTFKRP